MSTEQRRQELLKPPGTKKEDRKAKAKEFCLVLHAYVTGAWVGLFHQYGWGIFVGILIIFSLMFSPFYQHSND